MKPIFTAAALQHRNFVEARHQFIELVRSSAGGKVIALVGPTQVGKSLIFKHLIKTLESELRPANPLMMPLVHLVVATSQDGRISPKHLTVKLLKAIRHPIYEHIGEFDELEHYRPSRNRDEGSMRVALEVGLDARGTIRVLLDEAHHLTHTKSREVRSNVLQSIKCLAAIDRTLVLVGGYELVYRGLFDSAHFAGRLVCVELPPYTSTASDLNEWEKIIKFLSKCVAVSPKTLLLDEAEELLDATNGCFGLLEKLLWSASATSGDQNITRTSLHAAFPSKREHEAIQVDIRSGRAALAELNLKSSNHFERAPETSSGKKSKRPFQRKPNRELPGKPVMGDE